MGGLKQGTEDVLDAILELVAEEVLGELLDEFCACAELRVCTGEEEGKLEKQVGFSNPVPNVCTCQAQLESHPTCFC